MEKALDLISIGLPAIYSGAKNMVEEKLQHWTLSVFFKSILELIKPKLHPSYNHFTKACNRYFCVVACNHMVLRSTHNLFYVI